MNIRRLTYFAPAVLLASAWASPALAGPTTKTVTVQGSVANTCGLSSTSVTFTVARSGSLTTSYSPAATAFCNSPNGGTLTVRSTPLQSSGETSVNYTVTVSGWGSAISYSTTGNPAASTGATTAQTSVTLAFTNSTLAQNNFTNNKIYTAIITLGLSPKP